MSKTQGERIAKVGIYMRLSQEDRKETQSQSIINQSKMLHQYVREHGMHVAEEYIDDGYSGTTFDRPAFLRMKSDIENKKINIVITKDLSRLGRNYSEAGYYQDVFFPEHQIRLIALGEGYDSNNEYSTASAPWMNVANEQYARDISKKICAAFGVKMREGQFISPFPIYGYAKDPANKNHLIVDNATAPIVKRIFQMAYVGLPPKQIANVLNTESIMTPAQYRCFVHPELNIENYSARQVWTSSSLSKMLHNRTYTGCTVQGRTKKASFKSKVILNVPQSDWIIHEAMHEPIVSQEMFDGVGKCVAKRRSTQQTGFKNVFHGIVFCADCGRAMSPTGTRKKGSKYNLSCGSYKLYGSSSCSNHFIDYDSLCKLVLDEIKGKAELVSGEEWEKIHDILHAQTKEHHQSNEGLSAKVTEMQSRSKEIDRTIQRLYEDNVRGLISDDRFKKMCDQLESQQVTLQTQIFAITTNLPNSAAPSLQDYKTFKEIADKTVFTDTLTRAQCLCFIERIEVHQGTWDAEKTGKRKSQKVSIHLRFIDFINE